MSMEFSRRAFLKYTALTAAAVAGSSLLSGCNIADPNRPTGKTGATLSLMGKHTLTDPVYDAANNTLKFHMNIVCTSDNSLSVKSDYFTLYVTHADKKVSEYNNYGEQGHVTLSFGTEYLPKNSKLETDVTVSGVTIASGDTVKVCYWPRPVSATGNDIYQDVFATWDITADIPAAAASSAT